ncbi:MAG: SsrA-binding protein SmpB [Clostridia bacterium]|nr:SsrA-binding protein SmpB [Clostridia bacterium]
MAKAKNDGVKVVAQNRKARHDYFIEQTYEAGIALVGTEVKSIRQGKVNLRDSYIAIKNGEAILQGMHVTPYEQGNRFNHDPMRNRVLLLHKREINRLEVAASREGMTLIPLDLYLKKGLVKVTVAIAKGKKLYDKRDSEAQRDAKRQMDRALRNRG